MVTADTYRLSDAPICNVDPFLQLAPELEQQFWSSPTTMNIVRYLDLVAYSLPIINLIMTVPRRMKEVPQDIQLPLGARLFLLAYVAVAVAMLVLLVGRPEVYKRNRMNLAMLNRTFRLVLTGLLTHPETVLGYGTQTAAVGKAAIRGNIAWALLLSLFAPTAMHLQHTNLVLPLRFLVPFQLGNYIVSAMWATGMPCWLAADGHTYRAVTHTLNSSTQQPFLPPLHSCPQLFGANLLADTCMGSQSIDIQAADAADALSQAASQACHKLHLVQLLSSTLVPLAPSLAAGPGDMCKGSGAFQVLYLYVAAVLLLIIPLTCAYFLEFWAKAQYLKLRGMHAVWLPWSVFWAATAQPGSSAAAQQQQSQQGTKTWLVLLLPLLLLQLPWALAQVVVSKMHGSCSPALAEYTWMRGLW